MKSFDAVAPHRLELLLYAVLAVLITMIGNLETFARQLGLFDVEANQTAFETTKEYIQQAIGYIDGFSITAASAVFVFWSLVGVLTLNIIRAVYDVYRELSQDVEVATKFYHPSNYSNAKFWINVLLQTITSFGLYVIALFSVFFVSVVLSPITIYSLQDVASNPTVAGFSILIVGLLALWGGLIILGVSTRLILLHKQFDV